MPIPELRWFASDGTTPIALLTLSPIGPGETYSVKHGAPKDFVVRNTGAASVDVNVRILPFSIYPTNEFLRIAVGEAQPAPGAFVDYTDPDLAVGVLAAAASARIWVDAVVPIDADRGYGQIANLRAIAEAVL